MIPPLALVRAGAANQTAVRWCYSPGTYELSTVYCPFPFMVRAYGQTDPAVVAQRRAT